MFLCCEKCDAHSPTAPTEDDIIDVAVDAGWTVDGINDFDKDLCPECRKAAGL